MTPFQSTRPAGAGQQPRDAVSGFATQARQSAKSAPRQRLGSRSTGPPSRAFNPRRRISRQRARGLNPGSPDANRSGQRPAPTRTCGNPSTLLTAAGFTRSQARRPARTRTAPTPARLDPRNRHCWGPQQSRFRAQAQARHGRPPPSPQRGEAVHAGGRRDDSPAIHRPGFPPPGHNHSYLPTIVDANRSIQPPAPTRTT